MEYIFDFSNLDKIHEIFCKKNDQLVGKFEIETPEIIWIDEFVCLRSKGYSFKRGNRNTNKLKSFYFEILFEKY